MADLKEIQRVADEAENSSEDILDAAGRYSEALDGYLHSEMEQLPYELEPVSANQLYRETKLFVNRMEDCQERIERLREAKRHLERANPHRTVPGEEVVKGRSLEQTVEDLYGTYLENFRKAGKVAARGEKEPGTPDPMYMKSEMSRDTDPFEENMSMIRMLEQGY